MRVLDTPISRLYGRTLREVLLLCGGVALCVFEVVYHDPINPFFLGFYMLATVLFAARFYATRVAGVGLMVSVIGLSLFDIRYGDNWEGTELWWGMWAMLPGLVLLLSSDLRQRFDRGPRHSGWRTNHWRDLPRNHWIASCWLAYLLALLANLLIIPWWNTDMPVTWPLLVGSIAAASIFLLIFGRSIAFLVALIAAGAALAAVWPHVWSSEAYLADAYATPPTHVLWASRPSFALPTAITSIAVLAIATPYAARHAWRSLTR